MIDDLIVSPLIVVTIIIGCIIPGCSLFFVPVPAIINVGIIEYFLTFVDGQLMDQIRIDDSFETS